MSFPFFFALLTSSARALRLRPSAFFSLHPSQSRAIRGCARGFFGSALLTSSSLRGASARRPSGRASAAAPTARRPSRFPPFASPYRSPPFSLSSLRVALPVAALLAFFPSRRPTGRRPSHFLPFASPYRSPPFSLRCFGGSAGFALTPPYARFSSFSLRCFGGSAGFALTPPYARSSLFVLRRAGCALTRLRKCCPCFGGRAAPLPAFASAIRARAPATPERLPSLPSGCLEVSRPRPTLPSPSALRSAS